MRESVVCLFITCWGTSRESRAAQGTGEAAHAQERSEDKQELA